MFFLFIKSFHIIFFVSLMSGLLYLPRLFVYHSNICDKLIYNTFLLMEKNLIFYIIIPSFLIVILTGILLLYFSPLSYANFFWIYLKFFFVLLLLFFKLFFIYCYILFKKEKNIYKSKFFRICNEIPFLIFIFIVFLVILKPF